MMTPMERPPNSCSCGGVCKAADCLAAHAVAHLWVSIRKTGNDVTGGIDNDGVKMMMMNAG